MNYYPRFPGDYLRKTVGLSMIEDGAYTRLLDLYYSDEKPIEHERRYAAGRATTPAERKAVDYVLSKFFSRDGELHRHERADEEIAKAAPRIEAAKQNGQKGGRRPKDNPPGNPPGSPKDNPPGNPNANPAAIPADNPTGNPSATHGASSPSPTPEEESLELLPPSSGARGREREGEGDDDLDPGDSTVTPTPYGAITLRLRQAGVQRANPGHLGFKALVDAGTTAEEFLAYTAAALTKRDPFAYLIATVEGERKRVAEKRGTALQGPIKPARNDTWRESDAGLLRMAQQLGVPQYGDDTIDVWERRIVSAWRRAGEPAPKSLEAA